jgi:hypothetical protein
MRGFKRQSYINGLLTAATHKHTGLLAANSVREKSCRYFPDFVFRSCRSPERPDSRLILWTKSTIGSFAAPFRALEPSVEWTLAYPRQHRPRVVPKLLRCSKDVVCLKSPMRAFAKVSTESGIGSSNTGAVMQRKSFRALQRTPFTNSSKSRLFRMIATFSRFMTSKTTFVRIGCAGNV